MKRSLSFDLKLKIYYMLLKISLQLINYDIPSPSPRPNGTTEGPKYDLLMLFSIHLSSSKSHQKITFHENHVYETHAEFLLEISQEVYSSTSFSNSWK